MTAIVRVTAGWPWGVVVEIECADLDAAMRLAKGYGADLVFDGRRGDALLFVLETPQ